jgi:uncharacterized protein YprB with RNaseH-like and TPR domain
MSIRKIKNVLYFDTETLSLNPYTIDAKLISTQVLFNGEMRVEKEWELGEKPLIEKLLSGLYNLEKWTPMVTYNGLFDFAYILGRMYQLSFSTQSIKDMHEALITGKRVDLMQFDNGYFVSLDAICNKYNIPRECPYDGKDIKRLYEMKEKGYDYIVAHGKDDVNRLYRLNVETPLGNRFFIDEIGVLNAKRV